MQTGSTKDNQGLKTLPNKHAVSTSNDMRLSQHGGEQPTGGLTGKTDMKLSQHGGEQVK